VKFWGEVLSRLNNLAKDRRKKEFSQSKGSRMSRMTLSNILTSRKKHAFAGLVLFLGSCGLMGCATVPESSLGAPDLEAGQQLLDRPLPRPNMPDRYPVAAAPLPQPQVRATPMRGPWAPKVAARNWKFIVIHHSASPTGNAAAFDRQHRTQNGWDELGYHFVIGNGRGSGDGLVEVGPRWWKQKYGAHAKTPDNRFNNFGVGICLVGNFETARPTAQQQRQLATLVAWLMTTYDIPPQKAIATPNPLPAPANFST
jgi:N-acetylmuramoyl-L-alanine amidase